MVPFLSFLKNMTQLILSPQHAWEEIEEEDRNPQWLMEHGFYPMLALVAITAFLHGLYGADPFSYGRQLQEAIVQVAALFASMMVSRAVMETLLRHFTDSTASVEAMSVVCIYCYSLTGLINVIVNLCPINLALLWFLPAFVAIVAWKSQDFLCVSRFKQGQFVIFALLVFVIFPIAVENLLKLII